MNINNNEEVFVQFDDAVTHIKQHLAQWNNFEDITQPQIIVVYRKENDTPTIGISTGDGINVQDIFGRR